MDKDVVDTADCTIAIPYVITNVKGIPFLGPIIPIVSSGSDFGRLWFGFIFGRMMICTGKWSTRQQVGPMENEWVYPNVQPTKGYGNNIRMQI